MTYYFDHKETPPVGPDDDGKGGDGPDDKKDLKAKHSKGFHLG